MATRTRPADTCNLIVRIRGVSYTARPITPQAPDITRAWRLRRPDGTTYVVADTEDGAVCECGDYVYRHEGRDQDGCKHVRALRALGLIDGAGDDPSDWPPWCDSHSYAVSR